MHTFTLSLIVNILLGITVISFVFPKAKQEYLKKKKLRETQRDKRRQLEKARFTKAVREEVRKYLQELQK